MISTLTEKEKMRMWHKLPIHLQEIMAETERRRRILNAIFTGTRYDRFNSRRDVY